MTETLVDAPNPFIVQWCTEHEASLAALGLGGVGWSELPRSEQYACLETTVGRTALLPVPEVSGVLAKQEFNNPSGSHYDRASLPTFRLFEERGYIQPGDELRDITSGSGGISLALFAKLLSYKARISLPDELPASRVYPMEYFGAEIVRTGPGYVQAMSDFQANEIRSLKRSEEWDLFRPDDPDIKAFFFTHRQNGKRVCYINHSENTVTPRAHQQLAAEMIAQTPQTPTAVVLAIGNWTTIAGVAPVIRQAWPQTLVIGAQPDASSDQRNYGLTIPDLTIPFRFKDEALLDAEVTISDSAREAMRETVNTNRPLEMQLGNSSLICLAAAKGIIETHGGPVLTINYDQAMRY